MFSALFRQAGAGLRILLVFTVLTGVLYPLAVYGVSRLPGLEANAEGSIVRVGGVPVGSEPIGVDPVDPNAAKNPTLDRYFHTRPSASAQGPLGPGDPSTSGGSNKAGDNQDLQKAVEQRKQLIAARESVAPSQVPPDAVTASASGVDPQISPAYAYLQANRVASQSGLPVETVRQIINEHLEGRALGVLGEPTVNVLDLNLAVRAATGH
jgi:K+-transporting ATPase ATPase C chain